ncbi:MAG: glycosyltransferase [Chloroflexi bacterium]|nr:glycosyltransferase [Chloroflexota bacterium]
MFGSVATTPKSLESYRQVIGDEKVREIQALAEPLRGAKVLHLNATAFGGGVAEILGTLVPLMNDVGLQADWQVIRGADEFFNVTKAMHNSLQGMYIPWTAKMYNIWSNYNAMNAQLFDQSYDFVVVHDPQPAGVLDFVRKNKPELGTGKWVWRCHIDLTDAQPEVWDFLRPYIEQYDGAIFTLRDYVKSDLKLEHVFAIPPAIDPLSPKNVDIPIETVGEVLTRYAVDLNRPMICQVSRFDPWKDPLGVIDVYRMLKKEVPDLQLVMVASMASDDPEGWSYYERTARRAGEDYDIHLLSNLNGVGNVEVNAFQRSSTVVLQKSIREGFGLVVSEALWKGRPVVAGKVGGIPLQIPNNRTGYLITTTEECAARTLELLQDPVKATEMGEAGREYVREHFLITRYLRDYLSLFNTVR